MTGNEVAAAFEKIAGCESKKRIAHIFDAHIRTVQTWYVTGAPPHIAMTIVAMLNGDLHPRGVRYHLQRIGRGRRDKQKIVPHVYPTPKTYPEGAQYPSRRRV
jgi:hypothetical protein